MNCIYWYNNLIIWLLLVMKLITLTGMNMAHIIIKKKLI